MNTTLHLAKQTFKFSAAHFLIFDDLHAERLHGHNYQVKLDISFDDKKLNSNRTLSQGYAIDFNILKSEIKKRLDEWDEYVLLPRLHPHMNFKENGASLEVKFRDRFYVFPKNEVVLLEINNTSVENFSQILARDFLARFRQYHVNRLRVTVAESNGQSASTTINT